MAGIFVFTLVLSRGVLSVVDGCVILDIEEISSASVVAWDKRMDRMNEEQRKGMLAECHQAVRCGELQRALVLARRAYRLRKQDPQVWQALAEIAEASGDWQAVGFWRGLIFFQQGTVCRLPENAEARAAMLWGLGWAFTSPQDVPYRTDVQWGGTGFVLRQDVVLGDRLPEELTGVPGYWVGVYHPWARMNIRGKMVEKFRSASTAIVDYDDMTYDLMRADPVQDVTLTPDAGESYLVPLGGSEADQELNLPMGTFSLAKHEVSFLRVEKPLRLTSQQPFWLGAPILLQHAPHRRKIILNILADGLCWDEQKREHGANIPNILRFFSKGLIFDEAYSGSEYTYPSLATIETGMLPTTSQIFEAKVLTRLEPDIVTLSEQMKRLGYYCVNVMGDGEGIYNGVTRGFDRMIINSTMQPAYEGMERTIRQLEAFGETDQFIFLHVSDPHPYNKDIKCREAAQTQLQPEDIVNIPDNNSVFSRADRRNQVSTRQCIRDMDRQLGYLFAYLQEHFREDEYLVCLYSDHGCSVYSDHPWLLSKMHGNTALMLRGGGVPQGVHAQELVSTADIYAILGHYVGFAVDEKHDANLPEACGGQRREMTVSQSIYRGQTRKICLRTERYACRFETEAFTRDDGTVDASSYSLHVFLREGEEETEAMDEAVRQAFHDYLKAHAEEFMLEGLE